MSVPSEGAGMMAPASRGDLVLLPWSLFVELVRRDAAGGGAKRSEAFTRAVCARAACSTIWATGRRHGSRRRYCSARCRRAAWAERQAQRYGKWDRIRGENP